MALKVAIREIAIDAALGLKSKAVCIKSNGIWFPIQYPFGFRDNSTGMAFDGLRMIFEGSKPYRRAIKLFGVL